MRTAVLKKLVANEGGTRERLRRKFFEVLAVGTAL